jgi:hypothetical protein
MEKFPVKLSLEFCHPQNLETPSAQGRWICRDSQRKICKIIMSCSGAFCCPSNWNPDLTALKHLRFHVGRGKVGGSKGTREGMDRGDQDVYLFSPNVSHRALLAWLSPLCTCNHTI